jgi:nuclear pore complex protein Nup98-Nup96
VFESYNRFWQDSPARVTPPLPWYAEDPPPPSGTSSPWRPPIGSLPTDALFSLIKLYSEPACSLSHILKPFSFGPSPVDYSLPWHLYILLSRCIGVRDFADRGDPGADVDMDNSSDEETRAEGHSPSADLLTSTYALQLEKLGMIQEAAFVLLHIEGSVGFVFFWFFFYTFTPSSHPHHPLRREKAIKDLLARSAPLLDEWMTRGLIGSLKIPRSWVNEAKVRDTPVVGSHHLFLYNIFNRLYMPLIRAKSGQRTSCISRLAFTMPRMNSRFPS